MEIVSEHPIEETLRSAAKTLNLTIPPRLPYMTIGEGQLLQAQLIEELARRIVSLEKHIDMHVPIYGSRLA